MQRFVVRNGGRDLPGAADAEADVGDAVVLFGDQRDERLVAEQRGEELPSEVESDVVPLPARDDLTALAQGDLQVALGRDAHSQIPD